MKTIVLKIEDAIYEKLKSFLEILPKDKVQIIERPEIPFVDDDEQKEIEMILREPDTKVYTKTKSFKI
jgi:hypothetical protein